MVVNLTFLAALPLLAVFGLPFAFAGGLRRESPELRLAIAFMGGTVVFTVWETILSVAGVPWTVVSVVLPLAVVSVTGAWLLARRDEVQVAPVHRSGWDALALLIAFAAGGHVVLSALSARSTSIDLFYIWGAKGLVFAEAGGIDAGWLSSPWSGHSHTTYPPLVPLTYAWGHEVAGAIPWRAALVSSAVWLLMAFPVVLKGLRSRLPSGEATIAACAWLLGIALAVTSSYSSGNAEPPLVFFTTVAIVALLAREKEFPSWVAPVALCGVVLTKTEGTILWILIVAGAILRDLLTRHSARNVLHRMSGMVVLPALSLATWIAFEVRHGLPLTDAARESIGVIRIGNLFPAIVESLRYLEAGSGRLAWGMAALLFALSWRSWRTVLPALALTGGMMAFLLVYYLHYQGDAMGMWVRWTLPRVSLTMLSALILAAATAGDATGSRREPTPAA